MLDFTDMFVGGVTTGNQGFRERERFTKKTTNNTNMINIGDENNTLNVESDPKMGLDQFDTDMEKRHWQEQVSAVSAENDSLRSQLVILQRERERDAETIRSLRHDVTAAANKHSAMLNEQRDLRNHWAQEKIELESRMFQLTALQTQVEGTMKKKEKDYEKLQAMLQKAQKDSQRGHKVGITVSKQIPKNSTQTKAVSAGATLLKDVECRALNATIAELTNENNSLRAAVESFNENTASLQTQFEAKLSQLTQRYHKEQEELLQQMQKSSEDESDETTSELKKTLSEEVGKLRKMGFEVERLRAELIESSNKIHEQDQLIHQALLGHLPGLASACIDNFESTDAATPVPTSKRSNADFHSSAMKYFSSPSNTSVSDVDIDLPPASPATRELLLSIGLSVPQLRMDPQSAVKTRLCL